MAVPVLGICVRREVAQQTPRIAGHCAAIAGMLDMANPVDDSDILLFDDILAPGYGRLNQATVDAMTLAARTDALILDPVYTGVAMAGLVARAGDGTIAAGAHTLFLHTGGTPALFGYANELGRWLDPTSA